MINCNCSCNGLFQGSTPTLEFTTNSPLTDIKQIYITFTQLGQVILEYDSSNHKYAFEYVQGDIKINLTLTEQDTFLFSPKYDINVQLRIVYNGGAVVASEISTLHMHPALKQEALTNGQSTS